MLSPKARSGFVYSQVGSRLLREGRRGGAHSPFRQFASGLMGSSLRQAAREQGLILECGAAIDTPFPSSLWLKKTAVSRASEEVMSSDQLQRAFQKNFGAWIEEAGQKPNLSHAKLYATEDLLEGIEAARVLVLSPHPDDELIGCGGTVLSLKKAGASVHVVQMTEGATCKALKNVSDEEKRSIRWEEAADVAEILGFHSKYWSTGQDYHLAANEETRCRMRQLLENLKPDLIFVPAATDRHPEHQLASRILEESLDHVSQSTRILEYPVWGFLSRPTHAVEVSGCHEEVLQALFRYRTAMKAEDYVSRCRVLAEYHGELGIGADRKPVEVFSAGCGD